MLMANPQLQAPPLYALQPTQDALRIDQSNLKKASLVFRALNNKERQRILDFIEKNKKIIVTQIYEQLQLKQSVASQHLGILRAAGIVKTEKKGRHIYYKINQPRIDEISLIVNYLVR